MALLRSAPHPLLTQGRVYEGGLGLQSTTKNSLSSLESTGKRLLPNSSRFLRVPDGQLQSAVLPKFREKKRMALVFKSGTPLSPRALLQGGDNPLPRRRLVDFLRVIPKLSRVYFKSPFRRALYAGIALFGGFYVAQTISLSFGALGVNDVIAAALCVLLAEYTTKYYHTRESMTFTVGLLNSFKMGFTYGLFIDAFKLAS